MSHITGRTRFATGVLAVAGVIAIASHGSAQDYSPMGPSQIAEVSQQDQKGKTVAPKAVTPSGAAPRQGTPGQITPRQTTPKQVTPKQVTPQQSTPRQTAPKQVTPKQVTPKQIDTPKRVTTPKQDVTPKVAAPKGTSPLTGRSSGPGLRTISARGTGRTVIRGQNYTVWRGSHRVRHDNRWRTFVALSALSAFFVGGTTYYPYAYISAPQPICEGETEDGCVLQWEEVPTLEGPRVFQCVAYCPWQ